MQSRTLSDHLKNEEFQRLSESWKYLTPWQRKVILWKSHLAAFPRRTLDILERHIQRRRSKFKPSYPAHWAGY